MESQIPISNVSSNDQTEIQNRISKASSKNTKQLNSTSRYCSEHLLAGLQGSLFYHCHLYCRGKRADTCRTWGAVMLFKLARKQKGREPTIEALPGFFHLPTAHRRENPAISLAMRPGRVRLQAELFSLAKSLSRASSVLKRCSSRTCCSIMFQFWLLLVLRKRQKKKNLRECLLCCLRSDFGTDPSPHLPYRPAPGPLLRTRHFLPRVKLASLPAPASQPLERSHTHTHTHTHLHTTNASQKPLSTAAMPLLLAPRLQAPLPCDV